MVYVGDKTVILFIYLHTNSLLESDLPYMERIAATSFLLEYTPLHLRILTTLLKVYVST